MDEVDGVSWVLSLLPKIATNWLLKMHLLSMPNPGHVGRPKLRNGFLVKQLMNGLNNYPDQRNRIKQQQQQQPLHIHSMITRINSTTKATALYTPSRSLKLS